MNKAIDILKIKINQCNVTIEIHTETIEEHESALKQENKFLEESISTRREYEAAIIKLGGTLEDEETC